MKFYLYVLSCFCLMVGE